MNKPRPMQHTPHRPRPLAKPGLATDAQKSPKIPHFLVRMVGKARAEGLLREAQFHHRHD